MALASQSQAAAFRFLRSGIGKTGSQNRSFGLVNSTNTAIFRITSAIQRGGFNILDINGQLIDTSGSGLYTLNAVDYSTVGPTGPWVNATVLTGDPSYNFPSLGSPGGTAFLVPISLPGVISGNVWVRMIVLTPPSQTVVFGPVTFIGIPPPDATSVVPADDYTTGGATVDIYGTDFQATPTVTFGGTPSTSVTFVSSTHIQALVPPAGAPGIVSIVVTNPDSQVDPTPINFTYKLLSPPDASFIGDPEQRTDGSYLVDCVFQVAKSEGAHLYGSFKYGAQKWGPDDTIWPVALSSPEYSIDGGNNWNTANAQPYDRKHTAVSPVDADGTYRQYDWVWNAFFDLPEDFEGEAIFRLTLSASPSTTITSGPFSVTSVVGVSSTSLVTSRRSALKIEDYLGSGPIYPWRRGPTDFMTAKGESLVKSAVQTILKTKAATDIWGGELEWNPGFGSLFWALKHAPGDDITEELAIGYAELALEQDARIDFQQAIVNYREIDGSQTMFIDVLYQLLGTDSLGNRVFLSDLEKVSVEV